MIEVPDELYEGLPLPCTDFGRRRTLGATARRPEGRSKVRVVASSLKTTSAAKGEWNEITLLLWWCRKKPRSIMCTEGLKSGARQSQWRRRARDSRRRSRSFRLAYRFAGGRSGLFIQDSVAYFEVLCTPSLCVIVTIDPIFKAAI
jgi:hypothetical protein